MKKVNFCNFVVYNFAAISLMCLFNPLIEIWYSAKMRCSQFPVVVLLALNFYIVGISAMLGSIRSSAGIFRPDRYLHIGMAALNIVVSIALVQVIGIIGVFLGTLLCLLIKEVSVLPSIVYRNIFHTSVKAYYKKLAMYFFTTVFSGAVTMYLCTGLITGGGIWLLLLRCVICVVVPNLIVIALYRKTEEFKYAYQLFKDTFLKMINRRKLAAG